MLHISLHFIIPLLISFLFYKKDWKFALLILIATMIVDIDHLLANLIYDPARCSIGFHPLHTWLAILVYFVLFFTPFIISKKLKKEKNKLLFFGMHLTGLGLLIHMALDWIDCFV